MKTLKTLILSLMLATASALASAASTTFINPVGPVTQSSADPFVMRHTDGNYYYVHTTQGWSALDITKASSLSGIGAGNTVRVWSAPTASCTGPNCYTTWIWAPELHYLQGAWYLYFAAGGTDKQHRVWAMKNTSADPTQGTWSSPVKVSDTADNWAIDQTVGVINGQMYMVWSEMIGGAFPQRLMIAKMSSPTSLVGRGTVISEPTLAWETVGNKVNEGPQFLIHNNQVHLSFSASGCWTDDYKLGWLSAPITADLTVASNWTKSDTPILQSASGAYGPGHNGFVKSPDGTEDWVVYHANPAPGQGCGDSRTTRIQKITWNGDTPVIGAPVSPGVPIARPAGEGTGTILYRLRNQAAGKVLSVDRSAPPLGATAWLWTDYGNTDQKWSIEPTSNGYVQLRSDYNGYVLDVLNRSTATGAGLITWSAHGGTNQQWQLLPNTTQYFDVKNRNSGLMLDDKDWSTSDGATVQQWTGNGLKPQRWLFERVN